MENNEQEFIPFGGKIAVLDDCCIISPKEYEKQMEASKKLIDALSDIGSAPIIISPRIEVKS